MRCFLVLLLILSLSLLGCKTDRLKVSGADSENPQKLYPEGVDLGGTVGIGSISDAEVRVYGFVGGAVDWQHPIGNGETDEMGQFSISIDGHHLGLPAVIRVLGHPTTSRLRCWSSLGCGQGVSFGDFYQPNEQLQINMIVPRLSKRTFANPSIFSHLAFESFKRSSSEGDATELTSYRIEQANTKVASRFGVLRDLTSLPQPDLATPDDALDQDVVRAMLVGMAALQAMQRRTGELDTHAALLGLSNQFGSVGLPDTSASDGLVSYTNVLDEASVLAGSAQQKYGLKLSGVLNQLDAQHLLITTVGVASPTQGYPSATAGLASIEKGKSLADSVRRFASSVDLTKLAGLTSLSQILNDGPSSMLDLFNAEMELESVLDDEGVDHVMSALGFMAEAAFAAVIDYYEHSTVMASYEGLHFQHHVAQNNHVFDFQTEYDPCQDLAEPCIAKLDITMVIRVTRFTGNAGTRTFAPDGLDIRVSGAVGVGDINLILPENDFQFRSIKPSISISDYAEDIWAGSDYRISADAMRLRLPFEITKSLTNKVHAHYKGFISMESGKVRLHYIDRSIATGDTEGQSKAVSEDVIRINNLEGLKVGLVDQPQENLASVIYINQAAPLVSEALTLRRSVIHCDSEAVGCEEKSDFFIEGETEDEFLSLNASAAYKTKLKGMLDSAFVQLTFSRNSLAATTIGNIQVSYPGHGAVLMGSFNNNGGMSALSASNLDGIDLFFNSGTGKRKGEVQNIYGDKIADVIDMGQWVKIHYINGDFESL